MRAWIHPIALAATALVLMSCGVTREVGDTIRSVFEEKRRTLETKRLSAADYESAVRGAIAGQLIGAAYGGSVSAPPNASPTDVTLAAWRPDWISRGLGSETILASVTLFEIMQLQGISADPVDAGLLFAKAPFAGSGANLASRMNIRAGVLPPESGHPSWNPFAAGADYQSNIALLALTAPGMPQTAARIVEPYAEMMAFGEGADGGRFAAGMLSAAFFAESVSDMVSQGMNSLPRGSRYADDIARAIAHHADNPTDWQGAWNLINERTGGDPNSARYVGACAAVSLLYGGGEFEPTLYLAARFGRGDGRIAQLAAGALGALQGYGRLPDSFLSAIPLMSNQAFRYSSHSLNTLVPAITAQARGVIQRRGGSIEELGSRMYFIVPVEGPFAPERRESFERSAFESEWASLDQRRAQSFAERLAAELIEWNEGWTIENCGMQVFAGRLDEYNGRSNVFLTHPLSLENPCRLSKRVEISAETPVLRVVAGASNLSDSAAWTLRIAIDGQYVYEREIAASGRDANWQDLKIDLSPYAGRAVNLMLENAASGEALAAAYWGRVEWTPMN